MCRVTFKTKEAPSLQYKVFMLFESPDWYKTEKVVVVAE